MQIQRQYGDSSVVQPKETMEHVAITLSSNLPLPWSSQYSWRKTKANSPGSRSITTWTKPLCLFHWSHPLRDHSGLLSSIQLQSLGSLNSDVFLSPAWWLKTFLTLDLFLVLKTGQMTLLLCSYCLASSSLPFPCDKACSLAFEIVPVCPRTINCPGLLRTKGFPQS